MLETLGCILIMLVVPFGAILFWSPIIWIANIITDKRN